MTYVALDFETATGSHNSACALGMVRFADGKITDEFYTLINPPVMRFDLFNIGIHGIHQEDVKDSPTFADISGSVMAFIGDSVVMAHNAGFDTGFIKAAADKCEMPFENSYLDTVSMSRYVNPELKKHKLDVLAKYFDLGDFNHHRASDDSEMLALIFFKMLDKA